MQFYVILNVTMCNCNHTNCSLFSDIFAEELFEVTSCYFPIDFRPQPDDPRGVKREELILGLRSCLAATPKFAQVGYCKSGNFRAQLFSRFSDFELFHLFLNS